jgi:ornithine cyclodeaminase
MQSIFLMNCQAEYNIPIHIKKNVQQAIEHADIICTVTASKEPVVMGDWIAAGTHINAVGSSSALSRELDTTATIVKSKLLLTAMNPFLMKPEIF